MSFMPRTGFHLAAHALAAALWASALCADEAAPQSVARRWNEVLLTAIRSDFARPTVHARNLYHASAAMWDAWAAYDDDALAVLHAEKVESGDVEADREQAISYAAYRLLSWRFAASPGAAQSQARFDALMAELGYDPALTTTSGPSPAALGNRIAASVIAHGLQDGSNEQGRYLNRHYRPINPPLLPVFPGNPDIVDPNRWQPLALDFFIDQSGEPFPTGQPPFLSPEWGQVEPFALSDSELTAYQRGGFDYPVYHDPGPPPLLGGEGDGEYKRGFAQVVAWSGELDPAVGGLIDISPAGRGNNTLGSNDGLGYPLNPATGLPYASQLVPAGDYYRVLAEFWADGPTSETPPGHWFTIANTISDHALFARRIRGLGDELDPLEWDVKIYLALGGALHDVAVTVWGIKGWYDYVRPISAIRHMCDLGQSSDPQAGGYHPDGIPLLAGSIEVITPETAAPGARHQHLAGASGEHIGKIALHAWRGPAYIADPATDTAGVGWIRCENWWPYQRPTFVTPPFAGYVSGHSTFSSAAAEVLTWMTGSAFFPGGLSEFHAARNEFLVFEQGPSVDIVLQWASYRDAADESAISRIYGGIHPPQDDIPGRLIGVVVGRRAAVQSMRHFNVPPIVRGAVNGRGGRVHK